MSDEKIKVVSRILQDMFDENPKIIFFKQIITELEQIRSNITNRPFSYVYIIAERIDDAITTCKNFQKEIVNDLINEVKPK